jgi:predicted AlkP superfamily pyrophosphatase or phosphodiesterase
MLTGPASRAQAPERPRLVVGIVVDQMRWDYLYRYYDRYSSGGFRRMLNQGFSCENTFIPYIPTITACGHSTIYSGSVPALSGISGNFWWDRDLQRTVYCTQDDSVNTVGSTSNLGKMSPKNLLVTTICDELRLATNFRSKVIGVALKDRGGILPAGHSANAAYWYDSSTGDWITSTYYMSDLPNWVKDFNKQKLVEKYFKQGWNLLYPANTYTQSTADEKKYEGKPLGNKFPYDLTGFVGKSYGSLPVTPYGNTLTAEFAKAAVTNEKLGSDSITDFLAVSFSSPDYIGHTFGPNSIEAEDDFLRLDKELQGLLDFLDMKVGKGKYTVFLSADHGAVQVPEFLQENKIPAGRVFLAAIQDSLNRKLKERFKIPNVIVSHENYQLHLNHRALDSANINKQELLKWLTEQLSMTPGILRAFALADLGLVPLPHQLKEMVANGYNPRRNGDIQIILYPQYIDAYSLTGTTHGLWNPYDSHIPLLWYGWGINSGRTNRETYMTDIAATVAALLRIQMPSGCVGKVIDEVLRTK